MSEAEEKEADHIAALKSETPICTQKGCTEPAVFRYTWPGHPMSMACGVHALKVRDTANALGFVIHFEIIGT